MSEIVPFPRRGGVPASGAPQADQPTPRPASQHATIPFSLEELREIAEVLGEAFPAILTAVDEGGGSPTTLAFLDYLWTLNEGAPAAPAETF
jgi:hypothetical protein